MPYVTQDRRKELDAGIVPRKAGDLNYLITRLLIDYFVMNGESYTAINDCLGACEGAKLEFYRRIAVPYEEGKIEENGDVY